MVNRDFDARNKIKSFMFELNSFSSYPEHHRLLLPEDISRELGKNFHTVVSILRNEFYKGNVAKFKIPRPTYDLFPWEHRKGRKRISYRLTAKSINFLSKHIRTDENGRLYIQLPRSRMSRI